MIDEQPISYTKKPIPGEIQANGMVAPMSSVTASTPMTSSVPSSSATVPSSKKNDRRKFFAVIGLVVFLLVAGMGVYIALRQRLDDSQLAPNAPESRPSADVTQTASCTLSFDVPSDATPTPGVTPTPTPTPIACAEAAFDEQFDSATALAQFNTSGNGTATISNGRVNINVPAVSDEVPSPRYAMETKEPITGLFESGVVVSSMNTPNDNQGLVNLNADSDERDTTNNREVVTMSVRKTTGSERKVVFQTLKGGVTSTAIERSIASNAWVALKLERTADNRFIGSYDLGGGWITLGEVSGFSKPMYMRVAFRPDGSNTTTPTTAVSGSYERFWVSCPTTLAQATCVTDPFDDTFAGSSLNSRYISSPVFMGGSGTATVNNNLVNISIPTPSGSNFDPRHIFGPQKYYTGDFETSLVVNAVNFPNNNQGMVRLNLVGIPDAAGTTPFAPLTLVKVSGNTYTISAAAGAESNQVTNVTFTSGLKLKWVRENGKIAAYYETSQGSVKVGEYSYLGSEPITVRAVTRSDDGSNNQTGLTAVSSSYSRFSLVCPGTGGPTYACNSTCTTDANCQTVNTSYVCATIGSEKRCRLNTNTSSESCQAVVTTTPTPGTTPTPTVGCNNTCINNSDCANPDHICYNNRCRLATAPESASCTITTVVPTPTPTVGCGDTCNDNSDCSNSAHICYSNTCRLAENPTNQYCAPESAMNPPVGGQQPQLPTELPQTGPEDWANWLKVGLGVVVVGAVLMLFL